MPKYYWNADEFDHSDGEGLSMYPLAYHLEVLLQDALTHVRLYPAVMQKGTGDFWCTEHDFVGNSRMVSSDYDRCGRACNEYEPRNGKSGRCRHSAPVYDTAPAVLLLRDGSLVPAKQGGGLYAQAMNTPGVHVGAAMAQVKSASPAEQLEQMIKDA